MSVIRVAGSAVFLLATVTAANTAPDHSLPDPRATPGAVDVFFGHDVEEICGRRFSFSPRAPASYILKLKTEQLNDPKLGYEDKDPSHYEEDHLISVELGGAITQRGNLWPEPYAGKWNARVKDQIENELHRRVCLPQSDPNHLSLAGAQHAIATNWIDAYRRYLPATAPP